MYKNVSHVHTRETTLYHSVCVLSEPLTAVENTTDSGTPCPIQVQAPCLISSFSATVLWATVFCRTIFTTNTCQPRHNGCRNARCLDLSPLPCAWSRLAALPCLMARWRAGSQGSLSCSSSLIHSLARPFLHSLSRWRSTDAWRWHMTLNLTARAPFSSKCRPSKCPGPRTRCRHWHVIVSGQNRGTVATCLLCWVPCQHCFQL